MGFQCPINFRFSSGRLQSNGFWWEPEFQVWILSSFDQNKKHSDLTRPAEKLSVYQNAALAATGAVWTRYCFVIIPKNYYLASVNFFVFCTGLGLFLSIFLFKFLFQSNYCGSPTTNTQILKQQRAYNRTTNH